MSSNIPWDLKRLPDSAVTGLVGVMVEVKLLNDVIGYVSVAMGVAVDNEVGESVICRNTVEVSPGNTAGDTVEVSLGEVCGVTFAGRINNF
jgi:hypothetical protein